LPDLISEHGSPLLFNFLVHPVPIFFPGTEWNKFVDPCCRANQEDEISFRTNEVLKVLQLDEVYREKYIQRILENIYTRENILGQKLVPSRAKWTNRLCTEKSCRSQSKLESSITSPVFRRNLRRFFFPYFFPK